MALPDGVPPLLLGVTGAVMAMAGLFFFLNAVLPGRRARHLLPDRRAAVVVDDEVIASALARRARLAANVTQEQVMVIVSQEPGARQRPADLRRAAAHRTPSLRPCARELQEMAPVAHAGGADQRGHGRGDRGMNSTPRVLNRILIGILGIKLLAIGVLLILLATVPAVERWWHALVGRRLGIWRDLFERTRFPGRQESWLWIVIVLLLVLVIGLMVAWVAQQGKGRTNLLVAEEDPGEVPGDVRIGSGVAEQALRAALADRPGPGRRHGRQPTRSAANRP